MEIKKLFKDLEPFNGDTDKIFNAIQIPNYDFAKIGKSNKGYPAIMIALDIEDTQNVSEHIVLENLILYTDPNCIISDNDKKYMMNHSILVLLSSERVLVDCFLSLSQSMLELVANKRSYQNVKKILLEIVEIFKQTKTTPQKTIQGLWAELFIINQSKNIDTMIEHWHSSPNAIFDFTVNDHHLEVKSSVILDRVHSFSVEQLDPPDKSEVTIASVFTVQDEDGATVYDLMNAIVSRTLQSLNIYKLNSTVLKTIGSDADKIGHTKFSLPMALESLKFYRNISVPKITRSSVPKGITNIRYSVDLNFAENIALGDESQSWINENFILKNI